MRAYEFSSARFQRLQTVAATSIARLNGPNLDQAREAAQNLYEYVTSNEEIVRDAFLFVLDSAELRKAAKNSDPDIQHNVQQIIGLTEQNTPAGYRNLEHIQESYALDKREILEEIGVVKKDETEKRQIAKLEALFRLPLPPRAGNDLQPGHRLLP